MAKTFVETFVAEVTSLRALDVAELERHLSRIRGIISVSVTNPLADDPLEGDTEPRSRVQDYEE